MHIVRDSDTVEFIDDSGDTLVLLSSPRQRHVEASEQIEREEAMSSLASLKAQGVDTDAIMAEANKDPEALAKAREAATDAPAAAKVREYRLKVLGMFLIVAGERLGGEAVVTAYLDMDPASAAWIDDKVAQVWKAAVPSEADTRGKGADAPVLVSAPAEPTT